MSRFPGTCLNPSLDRGRWLYSSQIMSPTRKVASSADPTCEDDTKAKCAESHARPMAFQDCPSTPPRKVRKGSTGSPPQPVTPQQGTPPKRHRYAASTVVSSGLFCRPLFHECCSWPACCLTQQLQLLCACRTRICAGTPLTELCVAVCVMKMYCSTSFTPPTCAIRNVQYFSRLLACCAQHCV